MTTTTTIRFTETGIDLGDVAAELQRNGAASFIAAWNGLMGRITTHKSAVA